MAALSVVICNKNARIIFARQFFNITRMDLEEYIVQFSRGVDSCKEITHFESNKVRYIFIPIDSLYLILITTKNSNIIEDTEILKLIYRLIQDLCGAINSESIVTNAFEIMLGIDDIVSLGYRNSVNLGQIKQYLQMESIEEKEFKRKKREQEMAVQKALAEKGREFDKQRREKRFNKDAISSSSFNFEDEKTSSEKENSKENKELVIGKKKIEKKDDKEEEEDEDKDKDEKQKEEKEVVKEKKKSKGGLKLTKRKNFG
jgi:hypothetical protein